LPLKTRPRLSRGLKTPGARNWARPSSVTGPFAKALPPVITRLPAIATRLTVFVSPGSKRTAVPAGMSRRMP
jgi:hypothetical protein